MVEVIGAPQVPHAVAPPTDAQPDDYDARAFAADLLGAAVDVAAASLAAPHR